jgi:hypothetical protein
MFLNSNNQLSFFLDIINFPIIGNPPPPIQETRITKEDSEELRIINEATQETRIT